MSSREHWGWGFAARDLSGFIVLFFFFSFDVGLRQHARTQRAGVRMSQWRPHSVGLVCLLSVLAAAHVSASVVAANDPRPRIIAAFKAW